mmetsp:Transcript_53352/g.170948  ORF Transcript_53352/g.170948 Transcript_53352/m.170948 type:complete len:446 (+) Transcript_53352:55-1392(+)
MASAAPEPFTISVPEEQLEDLRRRLLAARVVPDEIEDAGRDPNGAWAYGTDRQTLQAYLHHWLEAFDWRRQEAALNALPHFTLPVRGLRTHFIHQRSEDPAAIPLLLVHGWPGSIVEFLKVIPPLAAAGFHVVAPSVPGYGWSEAPKRRGANTGFMAEQLHQLMMQLGYDQYAAQGGDWGGIITSFIAGQYPQHCVALHLNFCVAMPPRDWYGLLKTVLGLPFMSSEEWAGLASTRYFLQYETAYQQIQGTKPQSLAYGLNDSPVGLLAWILEKFQSWSDSRGGGPEDAGITKDEILTNVMVYWVTQTIASSCRIYYETLPYRPGATGGLLSAGGAPGYVPVPTGVLWARSELIKAPRHVAALAFNIKHWSPQEKGGHFFALEQPELLVADVRRFFREVVSFEQCKASPPRPGQGRPTEPGRYALLAAAAGALGLAAFRRLRSRL